jgi:hypothetical protein
VINPYFDRVQRFCSNKTAENNGLWINNWSERRVLQLFSFSGHRSRYINNLGSSKIISADTDLPGISSWRWKITLKLLELFYDDIVNENPEYVNRIHIIAGTEDFKEFIPLYFLPECYVCNFTMMEGNNCIINVIGDRYYELRKVNEFTLTQRILRIFKNENPYSL